VDPAPYAAPMLTHLGLDVTDQERSRRFYETYLGFGAAPPKRYPDGTLMLFGEDGFMLALGQAAAPPQLPPFLHFGRRLASAEAVRAFRSKAAADGLDVVEEWDEPTYVSVKVRDPDGYVVELFWEVRSES
jgi:catechol 2,3-dioxygenase-like lactoylglutathione lyase family enzyme